MGLQSPMNNRFKLVRGPEGERHPLQHRKPRLHTDTHIRCPRHHCRVAVGTTQNIANAVAFFASNESSNVTGSELFVDGDVTQV